MRRALIKRWDAIPRQPRTGATPATNRIADEEDAFRNGSRTRRLSSRSGGLAASARAPSHRAAATWEIVVACHNSRMAITVRGPETRATASAEGCDALLATGLLPAVAGARS